MAKADSACFTFDTRSHHRGGCRSTNLSHVETSPTLGCSLEIGVARHWKEASFVVHLSDLPRSVPELIPNTHNPYKYYFCSIDIRKKRRKLEPLRWNSFVYSSKNVKSALQVSANNTYRLKIDVPHVGSLVIKNLSNNLPFSHFLVESIALLRPWR